MNHPILRFQLLGLALLLLLVTNTFAASVGPAGYTNAFTTSPAAADWATLSRGGGGGDTYDPDVDVNANITAAGVTSAVLTDANNPPTQNALASWSSAGQYLATRPTGNRFTALMGKFVNNSGSNATRITLSYTLTFSSGSTAEDAGKGLRVYYSTSGALNTWSNLPAFNATANSGSFTLATNIAVNWTNGGNFYVLFIDDNGNTGTDNAGEIDNFSLGISEGVLPIFMVNVTTPANNAVYVSGTEIIASATVINGTAPYSVAYFTNSGSGNTSFNAAGTSTTAPFNVSLGTLPVGTYNIAAAANDSGAALTTSATNTFSIADPIALVLTAPANGALFDNSASIIAAADVSGGTAPYSVQFYVDDVPNGAAVTSAPYERNLGPLFVGSHAIKAIVTDAKGWASNSTVANIQITGPLGVTLTPTNEASALFGTPITLQAFPGGGTAPYSITFYTNLQAAGTVAAAPYTVALGILEPGAYVTVAAIQDSSIPAQQAASSSNLLTILPNPLVVSVTNPTNGQTAVAGQSMTFAAVASVAAPLSVASVEFFVDGVSVGIDTNAPFTRVLSSAVEGARHVYAIATDNLGRTTASATNVLNVVVDPLANNNFANRLALTAPASVDANNTGATTESGEPTFQFGQGQPFVPWGATLWWNWTAPVSGVATLNTFGSSINTVLSVYTGSAVNGLTLVARNDNAAGFSDVSQVSFTAVAGTEYQIQVGGFGGGFGGGTPAQGAFHLNLSMPPSVVITSPTNNSVFDFGTNISITATAASIAGTITKVDFYRGTNLIGTASNAPYSVVLTNAPAGTNTFFAVATDSVGQVGVSAGVNVGVFYQGITIVAPAEDTMFVSNAPIVFNAVARLASGSITNVEFFVDGESIGSDATAPFSVVASNLLGGTHRLTAVGLSDAGATYRSPAINFGIAVPFMPYASTWRYLDDGSDQSNTWIATTFNDGGWSNGIAPLGYSDSNGRLPATTNSFGPDSANKFPTTYYRQAVVVTNLGAFSQFRLNIERDDGTIVYLNGREVARFNMPAGPVTYTTYASANAADDGGTVFSATIASTNFVEGTNYFAVEVHQDSANSSDIWFQMQVLGLPFIIHNEPPTIAITSPTNEAIFIGANNIALAANAVDNDGTIVSVEFMLDGLPLATVTEEPYAAAWVSPVVGRHTLTAIARDNLGGVTESAPVTVYVFDALGKPIAEITSPTNNTIVEGPTNMLVTAFATALDAVTNVQFIINGSVIGEDAAAPYSLVWNAPFGVNEVVAVAFGANGLIGTSAVVTATITIPPTNTVPPTVATQFPPRFTHVTNANFTNVTIVFSERVQNVDASDLLVNGVPATSVSGSGSNYTFSFPRPPYGEVEVTFAGGHGITDFGYPSVLPFNELDGNGFWEYDYDDVIPPTIVSRFPTNGAFVTNLTTVAVTFSEPVMGVDASDLLVNGTPAFNVSGSGSNYVFNVIQPASGTVSISWAVSNGITDLGVTGPPLAFNRTGTGATWSFTLDSRTVLAQTNSTWRVFKALSEPSDPTNAWRQLAFDDSSWTVASAPFVYGEPTFTNALNPGTDVSDMASNAYSGLYLRKYFVVPNASAITNLLLLHRSDDGFIAWINGVEVYRYNVGPGELSYTNGASQQATESGGNSGVPFTSVTLTNNAAGALVNGTNVLAIRAVNVITNPPSSDFAFDAQLYTFLANSAVAPPRVVSLTPAVGDVFYFTNLIVRFSETVTNVDASDLLVNGVPATEVVSSGTNTTFNFSFAQPAYGPVAITWDSGHGIVDFDDPPKPFTPQTFNYTLVNPNAPRIIAQLPTSGATITGLTSVTITFNEPVTGVNAEDLLINGSPAMSVTGDETNFTFAVAQPAYGLVTIRFATNNGITDLEVPANAFDRNRPESQWNYSLVDPVPRVTMTSPTNGAVVLAPANVPLRATATDNDGTIVRVEYFEGATKIGEATSAPYDATWSSVPAGTYSLRAIATDNTGYTATSAPVVIEIVTELPALLTRGPYLQVGSPTGGVVRWRTDLFADSIVHFGPSPDALTNVATVAEPTTEHVVPVNGLQPDTVYYYSFGSSTRTLGGGTNATGSNYWFRTSPVPGTRKPTRFWVLGDSGTANANARAVRDAYYNYVATNGRPADIWLMLGDNAYNSGTDAEHQAAVFDMYPNTLRNLFLWPTIGNHETAQSTTATAFPYLDIFTLPTAGEAGGVPSGTEKYYSFDYANIHFICLDSMTSGRTSTTPMADWLRNDLAANTLEWVIVFFHHPPYTKGSHNSDAESDLVQIRQNLMPILEANGVDLVLNGHSHSYERSYLINGHYGLSTTFNDSMKVNAGNGREDGDGAYQKNAEHEGVVYTVAGSSGQISGGSLNHPAHFVGLNELGSMVIDVTSNRLDAVFLTAAGAIHDHFTIVKRGVDAPSGLIARDAGDNSILLTWNDVGDELGYIIERSLDGTNFVRYATNGLNITNFVDSGLLANTTYHYRLRSFNGGGESGVTTPVSDFTGNKAPVLGAITNAIRHVLSGLRVPVVAIDTDVPTNHLTFGLASAPAGARINSSNGVFGWIPGRADAGTTNTIQIRVSDDGVPPLSATQSFTVIVRDYVEVGLRQMVVGAGDRDSVRLTLHCSTMVSNVALTIMLPTNLLANPSIAAVAPTTASAALTAGSNSLLVEITPAAGEMLSGTYQFDLSLTAVAGQSSAILPLKIDEVVALRALPGLELTILRNAGRAIVVDGQPIAEAEQQENGNRSLTVYGRPGTACVIESSTDVENPSGWTVLTNVVLPALTNPVPVPPGQGRVFYRVRVTPAP